MKFNIKKNGISLKEETLFSVNIKIDDFLKYYKEIGKRFGEMCKIKTEEEKQEYLKKNYICDIDEVFELKTMSLDILQDYILFIKK